MLIQHLFGIMETPTLPGGRVPLLVEILAPNSRPVQVTEDLGGFWNGRLRREEIVRQGLAARHLFHRDKKYVVL